MYVCMYVCVCTRVCEYVLVDSVCVCVRVQCQRVKTSRAVENFCQCVWEAMKKLREKERGGSLRLSPETEQIYLAKFNILRLTKFD